jgi:hypothetical protein
MFKALRAFLSDSMDGEVSDESRRAAERFGANLEKFAFYEKIKQHLDAEYLESENLIDSKGLERIVRAVLSGDGLGFEALPKGLIPFHRYEQGARSAVLEHLIEGVSYVSDDHGAARFHFTVSDDTLDAFKVEIDTAIPSIEKSFGRSVEVEFSTQSPSTDTLALDENNEPFRMPDGRLLLRPSGHGALIDNLGHMTADVVFIKNIDNIAPQRLHETTVLWKRLLAGHFALLQQQAFALSEELETHPASSAAVDKALLFLRTQFAVEPPAQVAQGTLERRSSFARDRIDRPIRVAGIVRNQKEPGGGPFWVKNREGVISPQIVEGSQVDASQQGQKRVWTASTHLNPVDLVCGLTNRHGQPFDLTNYIDFETAFVSRKSHAGRPLMALERPGLWNGAMAGWNSAFVEVPNSTFTPVKTVFDLLRPEHQPSIRPESRSTR